MAPYNSGSNCLRLCEIGSHQPIRLDLNLFDDETMEKLFLLETLLYLTMCLGVFAALIWAISFCCKCFEKIEEIASCDIY
uniref:Uncharacterized protein n=1 Tax=Strongyloides stercoralis TaxID=6248 RepID=A0A913HM68_STRER